MLVIGLILNVLGIGLFCWLIFTLAVYGLPFFISLTVGMAAFHGGAGILGALLTGICAGALTLVLGQVAFAVVRPLILRVMIAAAFRNSGSRRRLSCSSRSVADRYAVFDLARGLRLDRRDPYW